MSELTKLYPFDLQLFADGDDPIDDPVDDPVNDPVDDPVDDPVVDDPIDDPIDDPEPPKDDKVPLSKYMAEKKKRQELEKVIKSQAMEREKFSLVQQYIDRGYPEGEAALLAEKDVAHKEDLDEVKSIKIDIEIDKLAKSDDFFSDAETFADEVKEKMKSLKISAKDAYMMVRGETRFREMQLKKEQLATAKRREAGAKKVENSTATPSKNPFPLDADDKKALARLKEMQPDSNWTEEKFFKIMKT